MIHISKRIFQNIIKIANHYTFSKLAVKHPPPFTCKPLSKKVLVFAEIVLKTTKKGRGKNIPRGKR